MDASDGEVENSVMVALLPITSEWCTLELPHMTLVYAGEKDKLPEGSFNELAKDAMSIAQMNSPIQVRVMGTDTFGPPETRVTVLKLQPTMQLLAMRRVVERWNASEFPFNPHCTVGPEGTFMEFTPRALAFDQVYVGWGEESLAFKMDRSSRY